MPESGPRMVPVDQREDGRGRLRVMDEPALRGFEVRRFFIVTQVPENRIRGGHAHRRCSQLLIAASGEVRVDTWHGGAHRSFLLHAQGPALLLPPRTYATQSHFSADAAIMVLADMAYDETSFIGFEEFFGPGHGPGPARKPQR